MNDEPLFEYMRDTLAPFGQYGSGRQSVVAATSFNTGEYVVMRSKDTEFSEWNRAVTSSASIPAVFPPQHYLNDILSDGGCGIHVVPDASGQGCIIINVLTGERQSFNMHYNGRCV